MNAETFKNIYYPFHSKLYRTALRIVGDDENAADVVQETYIKLWNNRDKLHEIDSPEAYALTTLRNMCFNVLRSPRKEFGNGYEANVAEQGCLISQIEMKDNIVHVNKLISMLSEQQQLIIKLRHYDDCSYEEICEITGLDIKNIRVIVSRTRKILREMFDKINR